MFVSADKACQVLDELTLPEGYNTTIKRQQRVNNTMESEVIAVDLQCHGRCPQQPIHEDGNIIALKHN